MAPSFWDVSRVPQSSLSGWYDVYIPSEMMTASRRIRFSKLDLMGGQGLVGGTTCAWSCSISTSTWSAGTGFR